MGIPFQITRDDLLRSKVVSPGWYPLLVRSVEKGEAKTDGSMKVSVVFIVQKDGPFKDVPIPHTFSEKAPGFAVAFIESANKKKIDGEKGGTFDLAQAQGRMVWGYVRNDTYQNRLINKVEDFRPYEEGEVLPKL